MSSVKLDQLLDSIVRSGLFRTAPAIESREGVRVRSGSRELTNFSGNDYLGYAQHPQILAAAAVAMKEFGTSSSASPLVCGRSRLHRELEEKIAALTRRDRAVLFSCGYMANLAVLTALTDQICDGVIMDRLDHASLIDGTRLSRSAFRRYRHNDTESLRRLLSGRHFAAPLVVTESIFSMDGDRAPLNEIAGLCAEYNALLVVDEAHAFGVLGADGGGALSESGLGQNDAPLMMATFGKALGGQGAFIAGDDRLIEWIIQKARPYIYSTAIPPPMVGAALAALDLLTVDHDSRLQLQANINHFRMTAGNHLPGHESTSSPIQPVILGDPQLAMRCRDHLMDRGYFVQAIRPPTVPAGTSRLRITLSALHTHDQIDGLLSSLADVRRGLSLSETVLEE